MCIFRDTPTPAAGKEFFRRMPTVALKWVQLLACQLPLLIFLFQWQVTEKNF
jgi:hypothetical protein